MGYILGRMERNEAPVRRGQMFRLREFVEDRFLPFVGASTLAKQSKRYYAAGWRMLESLPVADMRLGDDVLWDRKLIFVPEGKTRKATRYVPLSDRVRSLLYARPACGVKVGVPVLPQQNGPHHAHGD
jgi:hypothetical protein